MKYTSDVDKRDLLTIFGLDKKIQIKDTFFTMLTVPLEKKFEKIPFNEKATNIEDRIWERKLFKRIQIIYEPSASVTISMEFIKI